MHNAYLFLSQSTSVTSAYGSGLNRLPGWVRPVALKIVTVSTPYSSSSSSSVGSACVSDQVSTLILGTAQPKILSSSMDFCTLQFFVWAFTSVHNPLPL